MDCPQTKAQKRKLQKLMSSAGGATAVAPNPRTKCECGAAFIDKLRPEEDDHQGVPTLDIGGHQVKMRSLLFNEEAESPTLNPLIIDPVSIRPEALPLDVAWKDESNPEWIRLRTVMDSGAAESVGPPSMAPGIFPI